MPLVRRNKQNPQAGEAGMTPDSGFHESGWATPVRYNPFQDRFYARPNAGWEDQRPMRAMAKENLSVFEGEAGPPDRPSWSGYQGEPVPIPLPPQNETNIGQRQAPTVAGAMGSYPEGKPKMRPEGVPMMRPEGPPAMRPEGVPGRTPTIPRYAGRVRPTGGGAAPRRPNQMTPR